MDRLLFRNGIVAEVQVPKFRNSDFAVSPDHIMTSWQSRNAFDQSQRLRNRAKEQVAVDRFTAKLWRHQVGTQKRAHFGSENQLTVFLKIVERLNSERSARDETRLIEIVSIKSRVDYSGNTTHVFCPLSSVLCPLSSVLCPLSSVLTSYLSRSCPLVQRGFPGIGRIRRR